MSKTFENVDFGIMIEGQEDLTWKRFFGFLDAAENLGFESLFRSDHLTPLESKEPRETLALWPSLTTAAMRTKRIRFGPLVAPMTFRNPAMLAKMAASVSDLSGGRLDLGLGAGWYAGEHQMFGIPYPKYGVRLEMLEEAVQVVRLLLSGETGSFSGKHYNLDCAQNLPAASPPIIMGGKGEKTLQVVARYADEWNFTYNSAAVFAEYSHKVDQNCEAIGRDPATLRRSVMIPFVIGKTDRQIQAHLDGHRKTFPGFYTDIKSWLDAGLVGGTPDQVLEQLAGFVEAGCTRFMLQQNDLDDLDSLALLAEILF